MNDSKDDLSQTIQAKYDQPKPETLFTSVPLYQTFSLGDGLTDTGTAYRIVRFNGALEFYCSICQQAVVFISEVAERSRKLASGESVPFSIAGSASMPGHEQCVKSGIHITEFHCSREHKHIVQFVFFVEGDYDNEVVRLTKIGQYPSIADLTAGDIKKYRKILGPNDFAEFNRAIGLASHGIGIGSFVYLRRIFERLIEEAHHVSRADEGWSEDDYWKSRMEDKIKLLKAHLPPFLVQNWQIYSILSKGLHELSEHDCHTHFDVIKQSIELILDEKIEAQERQQKASELQESLRNIANSLH